MKHMDASVLAAAGKVPTESAISQRIVLNSRPLGKPVVENFRQEDLTVPVPKNGQILLRTLYLSLDPYMRGRLSNAPSYAAPVEPGQVIVGGTGSTFILRASVERSLPPVLPCGGSVA